MVVHSTMTTPELSTPACPRVQRAIPACHHPNQTPSSETKGLPLPRRMPTINPQIRARHKTTRIADQEYRSTTVLLRHAEFSQHILRGPVAAALGVLLEEGLDHGRDDVTGRDGVDADAVGAPFRREVAAELDDAGFGGVVGGAN